MSGAAVLIRGLVDVEEAERLVGDGEADLAVLVVEVRLADRCEGVGLEDRSSVLWDEGAEREGRRRRRASGAGIASRRIVAGNWVALWEPFEVLA